MKRFTQTGVLLVFVLVTFLAGGGSPQAFGHDAAPGYVVLGDSIEFGVGASDPATTAYVPMFHQRLTTDFFGGAADLHNLAISGATVRDINQKELFPAIAAIQDHSPVVVSWGGGGNDLRHFIASPEAATCARGNPSCFARLNALLNEIEHMMDLTLGTLRKVAGPNANILVRTQYNPLLRDSCGGPNDPLAQLANVVLEGGAPFLASGLNDRIRAVAAKHGARVAEIFLAFFIAPNTLVADDCIHPNDAGHAVIRDAFILAL
jgi:lysophospholipase L1-like esterase